MLVPSLDFVLGALLESPSDFVLVLQLEKERFAMWLF